MSFGGGSGIIWPSRFMIPTFFPQWFMIHLQFYFDIHDSFVHDTLRLNVSNSFSHFIKYPQLNESPKLKSQEKRYRRSTLSWLYSSPHVSVVMVTTKKFVYVFRAKRCQSPRISILEVIVFVLHTCTIKNDRKRHFVGTCSKGKRFPKTSVSDHLGVDERPTWNVKMVRVWSFLPSTLF